MTSDINTAMQQRQRRIAEVTEAIESLRSEPAQVFELRAPKVPNRYKCVAAGYFDDSKAMAEAAIQLEDRGVPGVYMLLNPVEHSLLARSCNRCQDNMENLSEDRDITKRSWLPIDVDPVRRAGISSNTEELEYARATIHRVEMWMTEQLGDPPAIRACSGNGWHALWRIDLPNDDKSTAIIKGIIDSAATKFSNKHACVDQSVFNAARIWKLYGTLARKGDEVSKLGRVWRRAHILKGGFDDIC